MTISLADYKPVETPNLGRCVRFSVTVLDDSGEPLMTQKGFLMARDRHIVTPRMKTKYGSWVSWVDLSDEFVAWLQDAMERVREVQEILGPKVEIER